MNVCRYTYFLDSIFKATAYKFGGGIAISKIPYS